MPKGADELERLRRFEMYRRQLIDFYRANNPSLLDTVDSTLKEWQGREEELFASLNAKYANSGSAAADLAKEDYDHVVKSLKVMYKKDPTSRRGVQV